MSRCEYFLTDYLYKYGNFDASAVKTTYVIEGYFDNMNFTAKNLDASTSMKNTRTETSYHDLSKKTRTWEFIICPTFGFLGSPEPLMKDCELKLSFDRSHPYTSVIASTKVDPKALSTPIVINDCVAITEYVSSPSLRSFFDHIEYEPIMYEYDACDVLIKNIPNNETEVRFENIRGGNVPLAMFAGVISQSCLQGDRLNSSTLFKNFDVEEMNFSLNGSSVNGYPITIKHGNPFLPMQKFFDTSGRYYNVASGDGLSALEFKWNFLWAHKFEAENASQGWLGINLKLKKAFTNNMCLVVWIISPTATALDKFHKIERINL